MSTAALRAVTVPELTAVPGLVHGFEQRPGPGTEGRDASRARVAAALAPRGRLLLLKQVHGCSVQRAPWAGRPQADAAVSEQPGMLLGIETADCLPVLLLDPRRRAVAAAHAGWRGTAAGVVREAVRALLEGGSSPGDLLAALGPAIGVCCYEVGEELRQAFAGEAGVLFRSGPRGRPHFDLRAANRRQLEQAGLRPERILSVEHCTYCRPELYHSYRREGTGTGRMTSWIGFAASS
jgi:YfiH family protein